MYYKKQCTGFTKLNGCEFNCYLDLDKRYHFHLLTLDDGSSDIPDGDNTYKSLFYTSLNEVQELIDELKSRHNLVFIAHPMNPYIPFEMLDILTNYDGIEVYNTKADSDATEVYSGLTKNRDIACLAVDDSHKLIVDEKRMFFQGYIVIEDGLEPLQAIKEKRYYSSTGVVINQILYTEKMIYVDTSADVKIYLYKDDSIEIHHQRRLLIEGVNKFRVVCSEGDKRAWSNLITV